MKKLINKKLFGLALAFAMVFAMSVPVFATEVIVEGEIGIQNPNDHVYKVSFNTTDVKWYVTEYSNKAVWNSPTETNTTNPYTITNTGNVAYTVTLDSFVQDNMDASTIESDLTLKLTGSLAQNDVGNIDLSASQDDIDTTYTATLGPGEANKWSYGFTGTYNASLTTSTNYNPQYVMTLTFGIAS